MLRFEWVDKGTVIFEKACAQEGFRGDSKGSSRQKAQEVKESETTTAVQEPVPPQKQNIGGGKVVSSSAMQVET